MENESPIDWEDLRLKQLAAASKVIQQDELPSPISWIAGTDVAYDNHSDTIVAVVAVLEVSTLQCVESQSFIGKAVFPYKPGYFSFRELPPLLEAFQKLKQMPDLVICDGQGLAHPRRFGLACHLGVTLDIPTIGCGKSKLFGTYEATQLEATRGATATLFNGSAQREILGAVLRTQDNRNPVFVSVGHKISLPTACQWVLHCCPKYRLPETTRIADALGRVLLNDLQQNMS